MLAIYVYFQRWIERNVGHYECILIGDSVELLVILFGLPTNVSDCIQIILAVFSSVQKGYAQCYTWMLKQTWSGDFKKPQNCIFSGGNCWCQSFTSYHFAVHLGKQPEITKTAIITDSVNIETCNKNWTLQQCRPSWIWAIIRNHKNSNYNS